MKVQAAFCQTWLETPKTGFLLAKTDVKTVTDKPKDKIVGLLNETNQAANLDKSDLIAKLVVIKTGADNRDDYDIKAKGNNKNNDTN